MRNADLRTLVFLLFFVLAGCNDTGSQTEAAQGSPAAAEPSAVARSADEEPPITYVLTVGDHTLTLTEGQRVRLQGSFDNPEVLLTAQPHRTFAHDGVSFRYPRTFGFNASLSDPASKSWALSGDDFKIMYFVLAGPVTVATFAQGMTAQFGEKNVEITEPESRITLGRETLVGTSMRITLASTPMAISVYRIPMEGSETRLLVLQDGLSQSNARSADGKEATELLKASFALKPE